MDHTWGDAHLARVLGDWSTAGDAPLHRLLASRLRDLIHTGQIPAATRLPSERNVARSLGLSRTTVVAAYDVLREEDLVQSRQGAGTYVTHAARYRNARGDSRLDTFLDAGTLKANLIDLRSAALPGLQMVTDEIHHLGTADVRDLVSSHGYDPYGLTALRQAIASYYRDLDLPTEAEQILVTSGAQQAIRLVVTALVEPGDTVLVEEPTFRGAIETLRAARAHIITVPSSPDGIDLPALKAQALRHRPTLIFIQAGGNNPTGGVPSTTERAQITRIAKQVNALLLEDAAVADAVIDYHIPPPLAKHGGLVATVGSASKSFWGGLRVGWLRVDNELLHTLTAVKGAEDLGTSLVAQVVTARLLKNIDAARAERRQVLRDSREFMLGRLSDQLPDWRFHIPQAGASLWVQLPTSYSTTFSQEARRAGVLVLPGPTFSPRDGLEEHIRLSYAAPLPTLDEGITRLADAWRRHLKRPSTNVS